MSLIFNGLNGFVVDAHCTKYTVELINPIKIMEKHDGVWYEKNIKGSININVEITQANIKTGVDPIYFNQPSSGYIIYNNYYYPVDVVVGGVFNVVSKFTIVLSWDGTKSVTKPIVLPKVPFVNKVISNGKKIEIHYETEPYSSDTIMLYYNDKKVQTSSIYKPYLTYDAPFEDTNYTFKIRSISVSGTYSDYSSEFTVKSGIETSKPSNIQHVLEGTGIKITFTKDAKTYKTELELDDVIIDTSFDNTFNVALALGKTYKYRLRSVSNTQYYSDWTQYYTITI